MISPTPLNVLLVEDSEDDARLLISALKKGGYAVTWERVETGSTMLESLRSHTWELIIADFNLPQFSGVAASRTLQDSGIDLPLILVSGSVTEEMAVDAMLAGAHDFIVKERPARLVPAVQRELAQAAQRRQRRALEEKLHREQERFRALVEKSAEVILVVDPAGRISYESPSSQRVLGYTAQERLGRHAFEFVHREDVAVLQRDLEELRQLPGAARVREFRYQRKDGSWRWLEGIATNLLHDPGVQGFVANIRDITERKLAEQALEESRQRLQAVLDHSPALIYMKDTSGRYILANRLFEHRFGPPGQSVLGKMTHEIFPRAVAELRHAHDSRVLAEGIPITTEETHETPDGVHTYLSVKFPLLDGQGRIYGVGGIATDITERKALEEQFLHSQKMEAFGQLAGGIAHDFNNILTAILIQLSLMQGLPGLTAELTQNLGELDESARRAAALTRQMLLFSRRQPIQKGKLNLNELLTSLVKMLRRVLGERVDLVFKPINDAVWITGDSGMIEQVAMNLCVNARDAMPRGGELVITTSIVDRRTEPPRNDCVPGMYACLAVIDNGCGMNQATLKRIFEPFFTTKEVGKGTGLGLATVYGIVKEHRGWIEVESAPDAGSTFRVYFLLEQPAAAAEATAMKTVGGNERILLVEDDEPVRIRMASCLRRAGYFVSEAGNADHARKAWNTLAGKIDLLLTDLALPGGAGGIELAREFFARSPILRVIVTSGNNDDTTSVDEFPVRFLPKPFESPALLTAVREALDQPAQTSSATPS